MTRITHESAIQSNSNQYSNRQKVHRKSLNDDSTGCLVKLPALKEGHVERRRVEVDELEDEDFKSKGIFILRLSPVHF